MKTLRLVAATALVSSVFALSASAAEKEWWNVDFTSPTPNGVQLTVSELGALTNDASTMAAEQPYTNGVWSAVDSDESYVTNEFNPSGSFGGDNCLRLDTQGNDLTWTPDATLVSNNVQTLVDADLYLVGSDSAPSDFDANNDVQAAIYLMNQVDDDTQETTNSLLCVYVYDENLESNVWVTLDGVTVEDNSWAHIQVKVDHAAAKPMVSVKIGDTQLHAFGDATATNWPVAFHSGKPTPAKISSVSFRGTGAVDNFVGKTVVEEVAYYDFTAEVYLDNTLTDSALDGNATRVQQAQEVKTGSTVPFAGFTLAEYDENDVPIRTLSKIVIVDPLTGAATATYNYTFDDVDEVVTPDVDDTAHVAFRMVSGYQSGPFTVTAPSAGAVSNAVVAKIYFTTVGGAVDPGVVDAGRGLEDYKADNPSADVPEPVAFNATTGLFEVSFVPPVAGRYVLITSESLNGPWTEDAGSAQTVDAGEPVTLTESTSSSTGKFFKIGFGN